MESGFLTRRNARSKGERQVWASEERLDLDSRKDQTLALQGLALSEARDHQVNVFDSRGKGVADLTLGVSTASNMCGISSYPSADGDKSGRINVQIDFETTEMLWISHSAEWDSNRLYEFTDLEIAELIRFGTLNVRLVGVKR